MLVWGAGWYLGTLCLHFGRSGLDFLFMEYNACPDRDHLVEEFLESEDIHLMDWLAKSPDLNHSKHVYEGLEKKNWNSLSTSQNYLELENRVVGRVRLIAIGTH